MARLRVLDRNPEQVWQDFGSSPLNTFVEGQRIGRFFRPHVVGAGASTNVRDETGGRFHDTGRSHRGEKGAAIQLRKDAVQIVRYFPKPADVRTDSAPAFAARYLRRRLVPGVIGEWRSPAGVTAALEKLAVHVKNAARSGLFVQVVHVLRAEEQAVREFALQIGEREMRGIRLGGGNTPAHGIEIPDQPRIASPGMRRSYLFDAIVSPKSTRPAKGWDSALGTDA